MVVVVVVVVMELVVIVSVAVGVVVGASASDSVADDCFVSSVAYSTVAGSVVSPFASGVVRAAPSAGSLVVSSSTPGSVTLRPPATGAVKLRRPPVGLRGCSFSVGAARSSSAFSRLPRAAVVERRRPNVGRVRVVGVKRARGVVTLPASGPAPSPLTNPVPFWAPPTLPKGRRVRVVKLRCVVDDPAGPSLPLAVAGWLFLKMNRLLPEPGCGRVGVTPPTRPPGRRTPPNVGSGRGRSVSTSPGSSRLLLASLPSCPNSRLPCRWISLSPSFSSPLYRCSSDELNRSASVVRSVASPPYAVGGAAVVLVVVVVVVRTNRFGRLGSSTEVRLIDFCSTGFAATVALSNEFSNACGRAGRFSEYAGLRLVGRAAGGAVSSPAPLSPLDRSVVDDALPPRGSGLRLRDGTNGDGPAGGAGLSPSALLADAGSSVVVDRRPLRASENEGRLRRVGTNFLIGSVGSGASVVTNLPVNLRRVAPKPRVEARAGIDSDSICWLSLGRGGSAFACPPATRFELGFGSVADAVSVESVSVALSSSSSACSPVRRFGRLSRLSLFSRSYPPGAISFDVSVMTVVKSELATLLSGKVGSAVNDSVVLVGVVEAGFSSRLPGRRCRRCSVLKEARDLGKGDLSSTAVEAAAGVVVEGVAVVVRRRFARCRLVVEMPVARSVTSLPSGSSVGASRAASEPSCVGLRGANGRREGARVVASVLSGAWALVSAAVVRSRAGLVGRVRPGMNVLFVLTSDTTTLSVVSTASVVLGGLYRTEASLRGCGVVVSTSAAFTLYRVVISFSSRLSVASSAWLGSSVDMSLRLSASRLFTVLSTLSDRPNGRPRKVERAGAGATVLKLSCTVVNAWAAVVPPVVSSLRLLNPYRRAVPSVSSMRSCVINGSSAMRV
uniref:Uncharacterized protein n=1 Tax=Anopheles merus TaxID=30066 RepID=A0A182VC40_ANOME